MRTYLDAGSVGFDSETSSLINVFQHANELDVDLEWWGFGGEACLPQLTASSGRAPASLPSNSCAVLTYTALSAPLRIRHALAMWCLTTPPPKMTLRARL